MNERYSLTQCPNAEFARTHGLMELLPVFCNSDYWWISQIQVRLSVRAHAGTPISATTSLSALKTRWLRNTK
ncbi:MAG: L-2-amino-thiazoline-4-carboxylic acid hydrolase [Oscillospiraceae bacterium]|nr:L-2-amino-thiazoline-4-carboxylic acid hydrolase [Oscillospiraceae bacterium]